MGWKAVIILVFVLGIAVHLFQLSQIYDSLRLEGVELKDVSFEGSILPIIPIPSDVKFNLVLTVNNPTAYVLDIQRITYRIEIGGETMLMDAKRDLVIRGVTPITIPIKVSLAQATESVLESLAADGQDVYVSGVIDIPIKLFGYVPIFTASVPYEHTTFLRTSDII